MKLIIGLGNPGSSYGNTRHNVGFALLDRLAKTRRLKWKKTRDFIYAGVSFGAESAALVKPACFMNHSGRAVKSCLQFFEQPVKELFVALDDVNLPLGEIRIREKGSAGGHHGLESIILELGTAQFARLRIGVGRAGLAGSDLTPFVLGNFEPQEEKALGQVLDSCAHVCSDWAQKGGRYVMNRWNSGKTSRK